MIKSKRIAVYGLGLEGVAAANYFGGLNEVTIFDRRPENDFEKQTIENLNEKVRVVLGADNFDEENFDLVIKSPGVKLNDQLLARLLHGGAKLTTGTEIFFEECPCEIIGVTGTKGKGTTSTLIYEMLKEQYDDVHLAGNIGVPMLEFLAKLSNDSIAVLELSSFQLMELKKSPHIAVVLMVTSEHLDWHKDLQEYIDAKKHICAHQKADDFTVVNDDFPNSKEVGGASGGKKIFFSTNHRVEGVFEQGGTIISSVGHEGQVCNIDDILLPGKHNIQNVMAAVAVAQIKGIPNNKIVKVLKTFKGLVHRLQLVGEHNSVRYYNDSFSTTPETAIAAIEAFSDPKVIVLGGSSKKSDFSQLAKVIVGAFNLKALILIGVEGPRIKSEIEKAGGFSGQIVEECKNMQEIVQVARKISEPGDVVILSPACASFDMFKNYKDRGEQFTAEVGKLS